MTKADQLLDRLDAMLTRAEKLFGGPIETPDWNTTLAARWRSQGSARHFQAIKKPHRIQLSDLQGVDEQKNDLVRNTEQFLAGLPANNALLWGSRGTGKSSLIKALLNQYSDHGLRLIEVDKDNLTDLPDIVALVEDQPQRFIVFCDDLSFDAGDARYKALKVVLDGSLAHSGDNVLIYATSNRRHLLPEMQRENLDTRNIDGEIHHGEAIEEKISLSERFGLWISFYPNRQDDYLAIVNHWLSTLGVDVIMNSATIREEALRWALAHGSRSGRSAWQFAKDWAGRTSLPASIQL